MNTLTRSEERRRVWLARNPGVLRKLADEFGVSPPFMTDVLQKKRNSKDGRIEARLTELGAPGFTAKAIETEE